MRYELNFDEDKVNDVLCKGGASYDLKECCDLLNEKETIILNLKLRLEKINGGYGHLTHKKGLTPNEWLLNKQERELKKKDEQISNWIEQHSKDIAKISEQQATINELKAQLREKEREERLYANEILELRETNKEHIKFKSLGGDY